MPSSRVRSVRALRRPALLRMPAAILHHLAGAFADELLLGGQRVIPDKAQLSGFAFRHETVRSALDAILGNAPVTRHDAVTKPALSDTKPALSAGRTACRSAIRRGRRSAAAFAAAARAAEGPTLAGGGPFTACCTIDASVGGADTPGRAATVTPWWAPRMKRAQMSTGMPPPVARRVGEELSLPSQTPVTRWAV